ncbi:MAG: DNA circularization N-terminal domain-containing protein [Pseudomonadota bacterium]
MGWLEQLRPASFRGVPFQVHTIEETGGDNIVLREYPFQDLPTVFRMGEGVKDIKFSAYVIGDDYIEQREALKEALTGEGMLMHPTGGAMQVYVVGRYSVKEAPTDEGGMARFELTFVRADARRYPVGVANTGSQAGSAAAAASAAAQEQFAVGFKTAGLPGWVGVRVLANLNAALDGVWGQLKAVQLGVSDFSNQLIGGYQALRTNLNELVSTPRALAGEIAMLFELPSEIDGALARDFQNAFAWAFDLSSKQDRSDFETVVIPASASSGHAGVGDAGLVIYGAGAGEALGLGGPARVQLDQMTAVCDQLFETLAVCGYVQAAAVLELTDYDEALIMRRAVNDQCTRLLAEASTQAAPVALTATSWHGAVQQLQTAALADLQARSRDLVRLTTYTPQAWEPVWVVSYKLFGTADWADEILTMNPHIEHALLVPPGRSLRIVRHD